MVFNITYSILTWYFVRNVVKPPTMSHLSYFFQWTTQIYAYVSLGDPLCVVLGTIDCDFFTSQKLLPSYSLNIQLMKCTTKQELLAHCFEYCFSDNTSLEFILLSICVIPKAIVWLPGALILSSCDFPVATRNTSLSSSFTSPPDCDDVYKHLLKSSSHSGYLDLVNPPEDSSWSSCWHS